MNSMRFRVFLLIVMPLALVAAACGGGSSNGSTPTSSASGPAISDEAYLKVICTGTENFSNALISKTNTADIAAVIKDFSSSLKAVNPPSDLQTFHQQFIKYLDNAVSEPTSLVTTPPPLPSDSARQRLASKESQVPECKDPTFFDAKATAVTASPTAVATK
jgi:hypothetical protein